jgi:hypothetical protein
MSLRLHRPGDRRRTPIPPLEPNGGEQRRWPVELGIGIDRTNWFYADEICAVLGLKQASPAVK